MTRTRTSSSSSSSSGRNETGRHSLYRDSSPIRLIGAVERINSRFTISPKSVHSQLSLTVPRTKGRFGYFVEAEWCSRCAALIPEPSVILEFARPVAQKTRCIFISLGRGRQACTSHFYNCAPFTVHGEFHFYNRSSREYAARRITVRCESNYKAYFHARGDRHTSRRETIR